MTQLGIDGYGFAWYAVHREFVERYALGGWVRDLTGDCTPQLCACGMGRIVLPHLHYHDIGSGTCHNVDRCLPWVAGGKA